MRNLHISSDLQRWDDKTTPKNSNAFQPSIPVEDIFEQLFASELRDGKLTRRRRKRLVQYAAQMGLSARQAGVLLERSYQRAIDDGHEPAMGHALRLVNPPEPKISEPMRITIIIAVSLIVDTLLIYWLW